MKKQLFILILTLAVCAMHAQVDTVMYEDFQINTISSIPKFYSGDDITWVNFDQDKVDTNEGSEKTKRWFFGQFFTNPIDSITGEIENVAISLSYLRDNSVVNRNWLILNPVEITDGSYMLHWESAPRQMPRYMDGCKILVSTTGNDVENGDFTDTLFVAASMDSIVGPSQTVDFGSFLFTPGYIHGREGTDDRYLVRGTAINWGLLEPHSLDLSDYSGKKIYIAFLHDSHDDDHISIDDILVTRSSTTSLSPKLVEDLRFEIYPNPVRNKLNVAFSLQVAQAISLEVFSISGQLVFKERLNQTIVGNNSHSLDLSHLEAGSYILKLQTTNAVQQITFSKH